MKYFSDFVDFTSEEFASDESFQSFVFRKNQPDINFWENFISQHPSKLPEINEAVEILSALTFKKKKAPAYIKQFELNRLLPVLSASEDDTTPFHREITQDPESNPSRWQIFRSSSWGRMAASLTGFFILFGATYFFYHGYLDNSIVSYETAYGENATVILPDSSVVILNGNTRLYHHTEWTDGSAREVWLEGEAFFDVKRKGRAEIARFVVHIPEMDVEVLGTTFNVYNRNDRANVVLNTGKVKLKIASNNDTSSMVMLPDEAVEFLRRDHTIIRTQVKAEILTSWRNKVLVFENTPLSEIGEMIEATHGVKVVFRDAVDASEKLTGTIPSDNLEVLLTVLSKSSNLHITRSDNQIIMEKRNVVPADQ